MINLTTLIPLILKEGGVSYNLNDGSYNPRNGYMVSLPGREFKFPILNEAILRAYIKDNLDQLCEDGNYLGVWIEAIDTVTFDISQNVATLKEAIRKGIKRNQQAIFDCCNSQVIYLPLNSEYGTAKQKEMYRDNLINETINRLQ